MTEKKWTAHFPPNEPPRVHRGDQGGFVVRGLSPEQEIKDAHLIASAPDLYEALEGLIKDMEKRAEWGVTGGHVDTDGVPVLAAGATAVRYAYEALAKARGET